ncbi:BamA/TamA family outer membrane protein [bacterium]|nr:BamA/TamA family outer membrane protein [bacterium]
MKRSALHCVIPSLVLLAACNPARHVPANQFLLNKVRIELDSTAKNMDTDELQTYLRQQPNHKMLWSARTRLGVYNLSGHDSTKWWNRWIRKIGEPPVIYDPRLTAEGAGQIRQALINKGYLSAKVDTLTCTDSVKRKANVTYRVHAGIPHTVRTFNCEISDSIISSIVLADSASWTIRPGDFLDRNRLDQQRQIITKSIRNHGYFSFMTENITFVADTVSDSYDVDLTMRISNTPLKSGLDKDFTAVRKYVIRDVIYVTDYNLSAGSNHERSAVDTVGYKDIKIVYGDSRYLSPSVLYENNFIRAGLPYSEDEIDRTYKALSRLEILKFINIRLEPAGTVGDIGLLNAYVLLTPGKSQSMSVEIEGTNSEGDLGVAVGLTYSHRNIGHGSETFTTKLRGAYESISGNLEGLLHNRYMEYSADVALQFPKFKAPFLKESFKRRINASTLLNVSMNYQERPEYTRIVSTAGWSYKWTEPLSNNRHTFTPIDINYVYLPQSTNDFINQIAPDNPLLRYSYEDHFIMRLGYSFYHTNKRPETPWQRQIQKNIYNIRVNAEFAGNFLFLLSSIFHHRSDFHEHPYKVFGIHYSQYFKFDSDFSFTHRFDSRQSVATRVGLGVGIPYGNSAIMPFEKRFYGGGANGVRGWAVRTLGPGSFKSINSVSDFMDQCGDIRFIMSAEYRAKLFWILELAGFIDVGNIWTIRDYPNQSGGLFCFNSFYKQLAAAYGVGLRLDFNYFLIRFDLGMKAHNPAEGEQPWPLLHPKWWRDRAFHFSIGYPF